MPNKHHDTEAPADQIETAMAMLTNNREGTYVCFICKKSFGEVETLKRHMEAHNRERTRLGICQKIYTTKFSGKRILHTENA